MRLRYLAVLLLLAIGVGAVGLVLFVPAAGSSATARFLTSTATRTTVRDQVVATASVSASATYGLGFGREPALVTSTTTASSGASSTAIVQKVSVKVADKVTKGQALASVDTTDSAAALATAQANLDSAKSKLADDTAAPTAATIASAQASIDQATQQLAQAKTSQADSKRQNDLTLARVTKVWTDARAAKATDIANGWGTTRQTADQVVIDQARQSLLETKAQLTASTHQAANSVASAELSLATAKSNFPTATAKTSESQLAADRASVASAETAVATAKRTVDLASIVSPVDGTVIAVAAVEGLAAPSGDAIQVAVSPMQVTAQFAEADITRIAVGQPATVTVSAIGAALDGVVRQVTPVASTSGTGSVVTYAVSVTITGEDPRLTSGMSASVAVVISQAAGVIAVPATALQRQGTAYAVRVVDTAGAVAARPVEVGLVTSSMAEITSGLDVGEQVVTGTVAARQGTTTTTQGGGGGVGIPGGGGGFPGGGGGFPGGGRQP